MRQLQRGDEVLELALRAAVAAASSARREALELEAELREQGIRMKTGAGSGGRQRKLLRRQRQWEQVAERLWQQTLLEQR